MNTSSEQSHNESKQEQLRHRRPLVLPDRAKGLNPFSWYQEMRDTQPVYYEPENELWHIFRYDDTQRILFDTTTFSSEAVRRMMPEKERNQTTDEENVLKLPSMLSLDPPRHRQLRSLVTQAFTPRTTTRQNQRITNIVDEYLTKVAHIGHMNIIADLAYPLPVTVIAEMLGVAAADQAQFKQWSDIIIRENREKGMQAGKEMGQYFKRMIQLRRTDPREDLISELIAAQVDGEHLTESELISFYLLLLIAGHETTTALLGNAFCCFDEQPEAMEELRANPELMASAIEEILRYRSPLQRLIRITTVDTMVGRQTIKAGQLISVWLGSANRDPEQFPHPETFNIHRSLNRHVGFGQGIHFCIGAPLARLEARIALNMLLGRFRNIKRDREFPLKRIPGESSVFGVQELSITFTLV